jgi:transcriptional regulator with XRE-family HTH domain
VIADDFSMRVRDARERLGMTQQQLADRLGVGRTTVQQWEAGARVVPMNRREQLAEKLGSALLTGGPDERGSDTSVPFGPEYEADFAGHPEASPPGRATADPRTVRTRMEFATLIGENPILAAELVRFGVAYHKVISGTDPAFGVDGASDYKKAAVRDAWRQCFSRTIAAASTEIMTVFDTNSVQYWDMMVKGAIARVDAIHTADPLTIWLGSVGDQYHRLQIEQASHVTIRRVYVLDELAPLLREPVWAHVVAQTEAGVANYVLHRSDAPYVRSMLLVDGSHLATAEYTIDGSSRISTRFSAVYDDVVTAAAQFDELLDHLDPIPVKVQSTRKDLKTTNNTAHTATVSARDILIEDWNERYPTYVVADDK